MSERKRERASERKRKRERERKRESDRKRAKERKVRERDEEKKKKRLSYPFLAVFVIFRNVLKYQCHSMYDMIRYDMTS